MTRTHELRDRRQRAGDWLRSRREQAGMTTGSLAAAMGVHQTSISNYEIGKNAIPEDRVQALARALRLDVIEVRRGLEMWVPDTAEPASRPATAEEGIRADETLTADQREWLLSMVAAFRRQPGSAPTGPDLYDTSYDPDRPPRDDWG